MKNTEAQVFVDLYTLTFSLLLQGCHVFRDSQPAIAKLQANIYKLVKEQCCAQSLYDRGLKLCSPECFLYFKVVR